MRTPPLDAVASAIIGLSMEGGDPLNVQIARAIVDGEVSDFHYEMIAARPEPDRSAVGWLPTQVGYPNADRINWSLLGGDAGVDWARRVSEAQEEVRVAAAVMVRDQAPLERLAWEITGAQATITATVASMIESGYEDRLGRFTSWVLRSQPRALGPQIAIDRKVMTRTQLLETYLVSVNGEPEVELRKLFLPIPGLLVPAFDAYRSAFLSAAVTASGVDIGFLEATLAESGDFDPEGAASLMIEEMLADALVELRLATIEDRVAAATALERLRQIGEAIRRKAARIISRGSGGRTQNPLPPATLSSVGQRILAAIGVATTGLRWIYGDIATRRVPFFNHEDKDGIIFDSETDERLLVIPIHLWIGTHYHPGDHAWCQCIWLPVLIWR